MPEPPPRLLRICVIATPVGDDADRALDALLATVANQLPLAATRAWKSADDASPSLAELHQSDVAFIYGRRMPLDGEALARVQWYCQRGRPLVVLSAGGGPTFARWPQFDSDVLGIEAAGTLAASHQPWRVDECAPSHPILVDTGFHELGGSFPQAIRLANDTDVLLEGRGTGSPQPLAWTRSNVSARVFATALGQLEHLALPALATLVGNALRWVTRRPATGE